MNHQVNGSSRLDGGLVSIHSDLQRKEVIDTIRQTVAKGASDAQLQMFLTLAGRYSLDPFLREIWCAQIGGQMTVMTSRDGYLKIAQRDPNFDGIVSATVCESDIFEIDPITPLVKHAFAGNRGRIIGAYAACFHKLRRPVVCFAPIDEYRKDTPIWRQYPSAMIVKVAESLALKRQFGISGLVTVEEVDGEPAASRPSQNSQENGGGAVSEAQPEMPDPPTSSVPPEVTSPAQPQQSIFASRRMLEEFACLRDVLGDEYFFRILAQNGYSAVSQIKSINDARRIWRQLVEAIQHINRKESN